METPKLDVNLPSKDDLLTTYLPQLIAAAVVALLLWIVTDGPWAAAAVIEVFINVLALAMVGMLISYVLVAVLTPDGLVARMSDSGLYKTLSDSLGYAMTISLGALLLDLLFAAQLSSTGDMDFLNSLFFLLMLLISALALMFFLNAMTKLSQISKLRMGGDVGSYVQEQAQDYGADDAEPVQDYGIDSGDAEEPVEYVQDFTLDDEDA